VLMRNMLGRLPYGYLLTFCRGCDLPEHDLMSLVIHA
jgi:hypothetical protein